MLRKTVLGCVWLVLCAHAARAETAVVLRAPLVSASNARAGTAVLTLDFARDRSGAIESARLLLEIDAALPAGEHISGLRLHNAAGGKTGPAVLEIPLPAADLLETPARFTSLVRLSGARAAALAGLAAQPELYYVSVATNAKPERLLRGQLLADARAYRTGAVGPEGAAAVLVAVRVARDAAGSVRSGTISFDVLARPAQEATVDGVHLHRGNGPAAIDSGISGPHSGIASAARSVDVDGSNAGALATLRALLDDPASCYVDVHAGNTALRAPLERNVHSFVGLLDDGAVLTTIRARRDGAGNIAGATCVVRAPGGGAAVILDSRGTRRLEAEDAAGFEAALARPADFFVQVHGRSIPLASRVASFQTTLAGAGGNRSAWLTVRSERDPEGSVKTTVLSVGTDGATPGIARLTGTGSAALELRPGPGGAQLEIGPTEAAGIADLERNPELAQLDVDGAKGPAVALPARLGSVVEGGGWSTAIVLRAPPGRSVRGVVKVSGLEGASATRAFESPAGGNSVVFAPTQPRRASGFATVYADGPVVLHSIVAAEDRASTGEASGTVAGTIALPVAVERTRGRDVEIAVAALADTGTHLVFSLSDERGSAARQVQIPVRPGEHFTASIAELFKLGEAAFTGTLTIERQWASFPAGKMVVTALQIAADRVAPVVLRVLR